MPSRPHQWRSQSCSISACRQSAAGEAETHRAPPAAARQVRRGRRRSAAAPARRPAPSRSQRSSCASPFAARSLLRAAAACRWQAGARSRRQEESGLTRPAGSRARGSAGATRAFSRRTKAWNSGRRPGRALDAEVVKRACTSGRVHAGRSAPPCSRADHRRGRAGRHAHALPAIGDGSREAEFAQRRHVGRARRCAPR